MRQRNNITQILKEKIIFLLFFLPILASAAILLLQPNNHQVSAATGIYETINAQGKLVDDDGTNASATCIATNICDFRFTIYDAATVGNNLWQETQSNITVTDGIFNVKLGSVTTLDDTDLENFNRDDLWVEIEFDENGDGDFADPNDQTFTPRIHMSSVPYAFNAKHFGGIASTGYVQISPTSAQTTGNVTTSLMHLNENGTGTPNLLELEVGGTDTFVIANTGDITTIGNITAADTKWIGLGGSAGRIIFDDEVATDYISFMNANVGIGTTIPRVRTDIIDTSVNGNPATSGTTQTHGLLRLDGAGATVLDFGINATSGLTWIQSTADTNLALTRTLSLNPNGGDVGIGMTDPETKLDVAGNINLDNYAVTSAGGLNRGYYVYKSGITSYGMKLQYTSGEYGTMMFGPNQANRFLSFGKVGAALEDDDMIEYMRIDLDNGNVGIGTTSPGRTLHVASTVSNIAQFLTSSTATIGGADSLILIDTTGSIAGSGSLTGLKVDLSGNSVTSYAATFEGGNVGIGTTAPGGPLEVSSSNVFNESTGANPHIIVNYNSSTAGGPGIKFTRTGAADWWGIQGDLSGAYRYFKIIGTVAGSTYDRLVIDAATGNVGIGITPTDLLHLSSTNGAFRIETNVGSNVTQDVLIASSINSYRSDVAKIQVQRGGSLGQGWNFVVTNTSGTTSEAMRISETGYTGFGDIAPSYRIELPNTANAAGQGRANQWVTYSDKRVKTDVITIDGALDLISHMNPVQYHALDSTDDGGVLNIGSKKSEDWQYGLIAQELYEIIPDAVEVPSDDTKDLWSISYTELTPFLIKGIQEQQEQIINLQDHKVLSEDYLSKLDQIISDYDNGLLGSNGSIDTLENLTITNTLIANSIQAQNGIFSDITVDNISISGNLSVTGLLTSSQIQAGVLEAFSSQNIIIKLSESLGDTAFEIQNNEGETVFSVDSTGKISIKSDQEGASVGTSEIEINETEVTIETTAVNENSKIFVTPKTNNEDIPVLGIKEIGQDYFIIKMDKPRNSNVKFDWWVIN